MRGVREMDAIDHVVTPPAVFPIDLDEVKKQRAFDGIEDLDTLFDVWIGAAVDFWEEQAGQQLITATRELWLPAFPYCQRAIELPYPPLQSVVSITYADAEGEDQTLDADTYTVIAPSMRNPRRGQVWLNAGCSWPSALCRPGSVRIQFTAGYGSAPGAVPDLVKYVLFALVGSYHRFRESMDEAQRTAIQELPTVAKDNLRMAMWASLPQLPKPLQEWDGDTWGV